MHIGLALDDFIIEREIRLSKLAVPLVHIKKLLKISIKLCFTCALNDSAGLGGSFLESPATIPRLISLTDTFLTLKPTLSPGRASVRASWCISTDLTSVLMPAGLNVYYCTGLDNASLHTAPQEPFQYLNTNNESGTRIIPDKTCLYFTLHTSVARIFWVRGKQFGE